MGRNEKRTGLQHEHAQGPRARGSRDLVPAVSAEHPASNNNGVERGAPIADCLVPGAAYEAAQDINGHRCALHVRRRLDCGTRVNQAIKGHGLSLSADKRAPDNADHQGLRQCLPIIAVRVLAEYRACLRCHPARLPTQRMLDPSSYRCSSLPLPNPSPSRSEGLKKPGSGRFYGSGLGFASRNDTEFLSLNGALSPELEGWPF
jgi:hypothetical protein